MRRRDFAGLFAALALATPALAQPAAKPTVSVDPVQAADAVGGTVTSDGMTALLTDILMRDGRFMVMERTAGGAPPTSGYVIRAAVTKFDANAGGSSLGVGGLPMGQLFAARAGVRSQKAVMEIAVRAVDAATGAVVAIARTQGVAKQSGVEATVVESNTGATANAGKFRNSPIGQAADDAMVKAVNQLATAMGAPAAPAPAGSQ